MVTLALDQALQTTGVSVMKDGELIKYDTFTIPAYKSIEIRLGEIWNKLNDLYHEYQFEYVFFEDIQQQRGNVETFKKLAYCQAAILLWCYFNEVKYSILSPSHWRKVLKDKYKVAFGRSREEQKKMAQALVKDIYDLEVSTDIADSNCIHEAGLIEYCDNRSAF